MAERLALSRLFAMRKPTAIPRSILEQVEDPTNYSQVMKHVSLTPKTNTPFYKNAGWEKPEVDFKVLRHASRAEPLFRRRANRFQNLIWKNGYVLKTEDEEAKDYILSRMEVYAVLNGETFDSFMREVSRELIMFDNCLILEKRKKVNELKKIGVNLPMRGIGPLAVKGPVVGYEVIPIDTIEYKRDKFGNVTEWSQLGQNGERKPFSPQEVILLRNDKESGDILAFPALQMVLPDARILRQLETDASLAGHRLAFPIFKYKVGDPRYEGTLPKKGDSLDDVWVTLEGMLLEGALIIPGSHDFEVVLSDVKMDGLHSIMAYFKDRVVTGMGLSPLHLGDPAAANRSVADRLDVQLYDDVKAFQKTLMETFNFYVLGKWLMEGSFNLKYGELGLSDSRVVIEFKEIDTDSMIKRENQALAIWVQDGITHDELRERLGLSPLPEGDTSGLYSDMIGAITNKYAESLVEKTAEVAPKPVVAAGPSKSTAQKTRGGGKQRSNAKTRVTKTSADEEPVITDFISLIRQITEQAHEDYSLDQVDKAWDALEYEVATYVAQRFPIPEGARVFDATDLTYLQILFQEELSYSLRQSMVLSLRSGLDRGFEEARLIDPDVAPMKISRFNQHVDTVLKSLNFYLEKLVTDLFQRVEEEIQQNDPPVLGVENAFLALHYRLDQVVSTHTALASNWGVCMAAEHAGYDHVWQDSEPGCNVCKSRWVATKDLQLRDVPPFSTHPHCGCRVHIRKDD
jgi:hypothetical protein